jgi:hypothetical protein
MRIVALNNLTDSTIYAGQSYQVPTNPGNDSDETDGVDTDLRVRIDGAAGETLHAPRETKRSRPSLSIPCRCLSLHPRPTPGNIPQPTGLSARR